MRVLLIVVMVFSCLMTTSCSGTEQFFEPVSEMSTLFDDYNLVVKQEYEIQSEQERALLETLAIEVQEAWEIDIAETDRFRDYPPELLTRLIADFDNDNTPELFAEVTSPPGSYIWYVDDTAQQVEFSMSSFSAMEPFTMEINGQTYVVFKAYYSAASTMDYMYGIRNGSPYETNISRNMIDGVNEYDEVCVVQTTYDASSDGAGRTWKPYWFYLGEADQFQEYGGIPISLDEVYAIPNAAAILDEALTDDAKITTIFYRANGIVNINYVLADQMEDRESRYYITLRIIDGQSKMEFTAGGIYLEAYLPELATFPNNIPFITDRSE